MRLAIVGKTAGRLSETRLLTEMMTELSKKHQVAILAIDIEGQPRAGIVPCKGKKDVGNWAASLKPEILFTFYPELVVPSFDRINICIILGNYRVQELEKYDLICSPYRDIKEELEDKGFYCIRVPLQANTKAFTDLKLKRKYELGMVGIDPVSLVNMNEECLVLSNGSESFNILEWSKLLGKKITVLVEESDKTLMKFYSSVKSCLVNRTDDYIALHALACGCETITSEHGKIDSISQEHIGKFPWLKLVENTKKHIREKEKWQKYQIIQQ